jgi:hypothetical protein
MSSAPLLSRENKEVQGVRLNEVKPILYTNTYISTYTYLPTYCTYTHTHIFAHLY